MNPHGTQVKSSKEFPVVAKHELERELLHEHLLVNFLDLAPSQHIQRLRFELLGGRGYEEIQKQMGGLVKIVRDGFRTCEVIDTEGRGPYEQITDFADVQLRNSSGRINSCAADSGLFAAWSSEQFVVLCQYSSDKPNATLHGDIGCIKKLVHSPSQIDCDI